MRELIGKIPTKDPAITEVVYLADMGEWGAFNKVYVPHFQAGRYPARTAIAAHQLILGARVEMECWADASTRP